MQWYAWTGLGLIALCALYAWLIAPGRNRPDAGAFTGGLFAHRGLHDGNHAVPENSLAAFRLAAEAGYGIELDVQLTKDKQLVVHHDGNTRRVCGVDAKISNTAYAALPALPDGSPIPTFAEVLALVDRQVPLIVEVKPDGGAVPNAAAALTELRAYSGVYCMESFHPLAVRYFYKHAPQVLRGQLARGDRRNPKEMGRLTYILLKYLPVNVFGRPHFISYHFPQDGNLSIWLMKHVFHPLLAAWTIRDQPALALARKEYDLFIFELFTPDQQTK